jgi:hypothetical protein
VEFLGKVRDRSVCTPELLQNAASGGIRQRGERGIEAGPGILNHVVQYITHALAACKGRLSARCVAGPCDRTRMGRRSTLGKDQNVAHVGLRDAMIQSISSGLSVEALPPRALVLMVLGNLANITLFSAAVLDAKPAVRRARSQPMCLDTCAGNSGWMQRADPSC